MKYTLLAAVLFLSLCALALSPSFPQSTASADHPSQPTRAAVSVTKTDFHGWDAISIRSETAEILIVPAIGRVMQFSLITSDRADKPSGPFWNNPNISIDLKPDSEGWTNFGGDKAWPAPQSDWPRIEGKGWPPPKAFDAMPCTESTIGDKVQLVCAVDRAYGIRVRRMISLEPQRPVMTIETTYEKVQGPPLQVGVWTITQLASPERAFILLAQHSALPNGYTNLLPAPPKDLKTDGRLLSITRDPVNKTMIGTDGEALLWVGRTPDLLIKNESPEATGEWPEKGSHSKIYTNSGDEMKYVEFELLGPLRMLKPGESSTLISTYTLIIRTESDPLREAKKVFGEPQH